MEDALDIRTLESADDFGRCFALQEETWGPEFGEAVPPSLLRINGRTGGTLGGAFDRDGRLAGFVFGLAGFEHGRPFHWSDMLAVRPEHRGSGLGRRLKLWQRDRCLERGVRRMHWSFDPLESRNAWLNLGRLGAVSREYVRDMYGPGESPLFRGIGTDRLIATWQMDDERVEERLAGRAPAPPGPEEVRGVPVAFAVDPDGGRPGASALDARDPAAFAGDALLVPVPADIQRLKAADLEAAVAWREATRAVFVPLLAGGWEVRELVRSPGPVSHYLLQRAATTEAAR